MGFLVCSFHLLKHEWNSLSSLCSPSLRITLFLFFLYKPVFILYCIFDLDSFFVFLLSTYLAINHVFLLFPFHLFSLIFLIPLAFTGGHSLAFVKTNFRWNVLIFFTILTNKFLRKYVISFYIQPIMVNIIFYFLFFFCTPKELLLLSSFIPVVHPIICGKKQILFKIVYEMGRRESFENLRRNYYEQNNLSLSDIVAVFLFIEFKCK